MARSRRYRDTNSNLRTQLNRILQKAGVEPWQRLFQNLRASRETELADTYPLHVVTAWRGNTPKVASQHYLQVTPEHFEQAITPKAAQVVQGVVHANSRMLQGQGLGGAGGGATGGAAASRNRAMSRNEQRETPRKQQSWLFPRSYRYPLNTPDRTRTCDLQFRKLPLYPPELRGRASETTCVSYLPGFPFPLIDTQQAPWPTVTPAPGRRTRVTWP